MKSSRSIRCAASPRRWVEVSTEPGDYVCPHCRGDIRVDKRSAVHEPVVSVECDAYPDADATTVWLWSEDDATCDSCDGDIELSDGVATHEPIEWVECPVHPEESPTLVFPWAEDEQVVCPHCRYTIDVESAEHEPVQEIDCLENPGEYSYISSGDLEALDLECPHCGSEIWEDEQGHAHHDRYLEPLRVGSQRRAYVVVHGFGNDEDADFSNWVEQIGRLGWKGDLYGYQWNSRSRLLSRLSAFLCVSGGRLPLAAELAPVAFFTDYRRARAEAEREGSRLARAVQELRRDCSDVRVLAFSLGCRVVRYALRELSRRGVRDAVRVRLCGGAVSVGEPWAAASRAAKGPIRNYYSEGDWVLKVAFPAGDLSTSAIGASGLHRAPDDRVRNHPAMVDGEWVSHKIGLSYEQAYADFGVL